MIHGDLLGERARISPGREALVEVASGRRLSYAELDRRARLCGRALLYGLGLKHGDRLAILCHNRLEMLDAFFAAGKCGLVLVPLNTRLTAPELQQILADAGARAVLYGGELGEVVGALQRSCPLVERWVALDERVDSGDDLYEELVSGQSDGGCGPLRPRPEDPYCLLYTSGTTGTPKGVVVPHRMVAWNAYNTVLNWQLGEDDRSPVFTPLYHAGGLGAFLTPLVAAGGTIVLHASFDAAEVWRTIEAERCTVVLGVPTIWKLLADAPEFATVNLRHVRWFISGGAPLPRHLIEVYRERGVVLRQGYGLTEVGVNCFAMSDADAWERSGSIGRPLMFTEARVVGPDGREVEVDVVGELVFRGPHVSSGYWNNPAATRAAVDGDGWFHTGDMARRDAGGFFYIAGRAKDMFISGGVNVYPAEVENVLLQHPAVADAAVIGVPHDTWGEVGVAFLVAADGASLVIEEIAAHLAARLARYKIPRELVIVDALPRTAYGKVVKAELAQMWNERGEQQG